MGSAREAAIALAKERFSERGYEVVSLQELATGCRAPAACSANWQADLLAEAIIALNDEQITWLESRPEATDESLPLQEAVERYLRQVYNLYQAHHPAPHKPPLGGSGLRSTSRIWKHCSRPRPPSTVSCFRKASAIGTHHQDTLVTLLRGLSPCGHAPSARGGVPCRDSTGPKADPPALTP